jgi:predicted DNA-binding transcriptional regulator AlpA
MKRNQHAKPEEECGEFATASGMVQGRLRRLLRTPDAAAYLALAESTLEKARLTGTGPKFARLGRCVVYDLADLDAWFDARKA